MISGKNNNYMLWNGLMLRFRNVCLVVVEFICLSMFSQYRVSCVCLSVYSVGIVFGGNLRKTSLSCHHVKCGIKSLNILVFTALV
jgi:hypothetical protein